MRILLTVVIMAAAHRGGCGPAPYDPCQGKVCGQTCTVCAPGDSRCAETAVVKACSPAGQCEPAGTFTCDASAACAGKRCGDPCAIEPPCAPLCLMPAILGTCDQAGRCGLPFPVCYDPCAGEACGAPCTVCQPGVPGCVETPVAKACDPAGQCVAGPAACP